jgi:hypothetical protein
MPATRRGSRMKRRDRHETLASGRLGCRLRPWYFLAETVSGCPLPAMRADLQVVASAVLAGCWESCDLGGRWATRRAAATLRACYCPESLLDYRCHPEARRRRADEGPPRTQPATGPVRFRGILRSLRSLRMTVMPCCPPLSWFGERSRSMRIVRSIASSCIGVE